MRQHPLFRSLLRVHLTLTLILALLLYAPPARADVAAIQPDNTFAGQWETSFGLMTLRQAGDSVEGVYIMNGLPCKVAGKVEGKALTFKYTEPNATGEGEFTLSADARRFTGKWRPIGTLDWGRWEGVRKLPPFSPDRFSGVWRTTFGKMRLIQTGNQVRGIYDYAGGSTITGTVTGRTLAFTYDQPDGEKGEGTFELAVDGLSFAGTWKAKAVAHRAPNGELAVEAGPANAGGAWSGQRLIPQAGRIWLVILESNWEQDLEDNEYSFGLMLRTFFARVPSIKVRHRFFSGEAEFKRWCSELAYIAEPVYLHISSHGTQDGISCDGQTIGAQTISQCLRHAADLRLLHFGSCLVAGGPVPGQIHKALGPAATFPISGYAHNADWGGSAVVDFTYLELVLSRGKSPADAVRQTRGMITFARDRGGAGDAIAPANLIVIEPAGN